MPRKLLLRFHRNSISTFLRKGNCGGDRVKLVELSREGGRVEGEFLEKYEWN
jgi:hypothetical protein